MGREGTLTPARSQRRTAARLAWEGALAGLGDADVADRLLTQLDESVRWPEVLAEVQRLALAPLFHLGLHSSPPLRATVPASVLEILRRASRTEAVRATRLERACVEVVTAATAEAIPVLVLKGLALGAMVYPSPAVRPMHDVDLLVAEEHREKLTAILHGLGYRNDLRGEEDFFLPGLTYSLDLHTGLLNTTRVPARGAIWPVSFDELWSRSQTFVVAGVPARTLGPCDTLLHLAIHAVHQHGLSGARWMVDLLACLRAWPLTSRQALAAPPAVRRSLWYCLEILSARGQDPVPDVRFAIRPRCVLPAEHWVLAAIDGGDVFEAIRYAFTLICLPRWKAKAAFLRQLLFPSSGVFADGFGDAGNSSPHLGQHWRVTAQLGLQGLQLTLAGRAPSRRRSTKAS